MREDPPRDRGEEKDSAEHIEEKHKGQQDAHVRLEFQRREDPGRDTNG